MNQTLILCKIQDGFKKRIETETVLTNTEGNNEGHVNFLQNMSFVEKSIETKAVFTKTKLNNIWNVDFFSKYELYWRCIETEAVFIKTN